MEWLAYHLRQRPAQDGGGGPVGVENIAGIIQGQDAVDRGVHDLAQYRALVIQTTAGTQGSERLNVERSQQDEYEGTQSRNQERRRSEQHIAGCISQGIRQ